jgi:glycosyltransferase involved in cell wall biosynthesis
VRRGAGAPATLYGSRRGEIVALIPAYQEGPRIGPVVEAARTYLPVVVVDDGSTDDTAARAEAAGATVLPQVPNAGKGAALRAGFRHALANGAEAVVTLDADGQHDPAEIPAFLAAFEASRPELVIGRRDFASMPPVRRRRTRSVAGSSRPRSGAPSRTTSPATGSSVAV